MRRMQIMLAVIAVIAIVSLAFDVAILFRLRDGPASSSPGQIEIEQPADSLGGQFGPTIAPSETAEEEEEEEEEERELEEEEERQKEEEEAEAQGGN